MNKTFNHESAHATVVSVLIAAGLVLAVPLGLSSQCDKDTKRLKAIDQVAEPSQTQLDEKNLIYSRPFYEAICRGLNTPLPEK